MDDDAATLSVGFLIDFQDSFGQLRSLDDIVGDVAANVFREFQRVEQATKGAINLGSATASITSFGNAVTKEAQTASREFNKVEKAGEALSRQLERQNSVFGKSREELRRMKVEAAALAAEEKGLAELAQRLRAQEAALYDKEFAATRRAQQEARALAEDKADAAQRAVAAAAKMHAEAAAAQKLAQEHAQLAAAVRGSHTAQQADAVSAERLKMATDPLYAATKRLNEEIAESTRLYHAGAIGQAEYARQQDVLSGRLNQLSTVHDAVGRATAKNGYVMTQFSFQLNDIATMAAMGAPPMQIFASQAGQIFQVAQMAEGGVKGFAAQLGSLALRFAPLIAVAGAAVAGFALFNRAMTADIDTKPMIEGLGLTRAEIKRLEGTTIGTGDVMTATFQVIAERVGFSLGNMSKWFNDALDWMTKASRVALAGIYSSFVGTFRAIGEIVRGVFDGKSVDEILSDAGDAYKGAFDEANKAMEQFGKDVRKQITDNKLEDLKKQAAEIKADRTPKTDRRAEQAARDAQAVEAQIAGLYRLADAYAVSGAAALIAEAQLKAETAAIKKRIDMDAALDRQLRLAVAERVSDAAKGASAMRDQAFAQEQVNKLVAEGLVPAERAAELLRERMEDLPLLAALEVAQQRGLKAEIDKVNAALESQRGAREAARQATADAQFNSATAAGNRRLEELREEIRLIGATDAERVKVLATLKATHEAESMNAGKRADYIAQQVEIADLEHQRQLRANAFNDSLRHQLDLLDALANNVSVAARGMADAFGSAGEALGGLASSFAGYIADQERLNHIRDAQLAAVSHIREEETRLQRQSEINSLHAARSMTAQIGLLGDMTVAAKGFFKERSSGYKAMEAAEKAFRAVEFALSVRAMAQDAAKTASDLANSGLRSAKYAVEAVAKAIASLPFPLNLAAGAATAAALASIGLAIGGSFGGGKNNLEPANDGTGTVLGDSAAKSDSIKRAIDSLKEVDQLTNVYAREMAASLRSIESQIGGVASLVVRAGNVNASGGVNTGFKQDTTGKVLEGLITGGGVLSKIPIIGGIIGGIGSVIGSLFGSKTKVIGSGLYGGAQSLESILGNGFDASYYSDVQKKKKFFGFTTGTSYSTQFTNADSGLENQFTLILREFNNAITAAAGPLGVATDEVQKRLNRFVVNIGKIDLQGLTGAQIEEKLTAVFGAAADSMAKAAFPGIERFQKVGEGVFETLVRVASIAEAVTSSFDLLGIAAGNMSIDTKLALAEQFESIGAMTGAVQAYFEAYYTPAEQAAAKTAQFAEVFKSLNMAMPSSLAGFRELVEAQDLTTAAGRAAYATLLQLAPAFADLQSAMVGAKSAADILSERQDLERRLLELQGDTEAIRALDLAKLDESNRALQQQIWALQDAQAAARAAEELRKAWSSVGDSIMEEVRRIRGLTGGNEDGSFASLMGQFNAATAAARAGDQDAAKSLPGLSQALLRAASLVATSRQELDRVQAQTAASLEQTHAVIAALTGTSPGNTESTLAAAANAAQASNPSGGAANDDLAAEMKQLREEVKRMREENSAGHAATAGNTGAIKRHLDNVTKDSGGDAISTVQAA